MKYTFDDELVKKSGLTLQEFLIALAIKSDSISIDDAITSLEDKRKIIRKKDGHYISQTLNDKVELILLDSDKHKPKEDRVIKLAERLREIFPKGKKEGTPYYWRCNTGEVTQKLKTFFKMYGNKYSDDQIVEAAKKYVESFNGNYQFMYLLKYFILKNKIEKGEVVEVSELLTYVENAGQEDDLKTDWRTQIS